MKIDNYIRFPFKEDDFTLNLLDFLKRKYKFNNPTYAANKRMGYPVYNVDPYIKTYFIENNEICIMRGKFKEIVENFNIQNKNMVFDLNTQPLDFEFKMIDDFKPYNYQQRCIDEIIFKRQFQGIIYARCAAGKTLISMMLIEELQQKTLILVHNTKLMKQWESEIKKFSNIKKIGLYYGAKKDIQDITIGLVQTVNTHIEVLKPHFGMVILDECHLAAADTFLKTLNGFNAKYRYGLSGSLKRKDGKHFLFPHAIGNIMSEITDKDVEGDNKKIDYKVIIVPTDFIYNEESENEIKRIKKLNAIKGNYDRKQDKRAKEIEKQLSNKLNYNEYLEQITSDKKRNKLIIDLLNKEINKNNKCVVFSERVLHCKNLNFQLQKADIKSMNVIGGSEKKIKVLDIFKYAREKMENNDLDTIVGTTQCIDQSMNIPILSIGIATCCGSANNSIKLKQQLGRITRFYENKEIAKLYILWDKNNDMFNSLPQNVKKVFGSNNVEMYK